MAEKDRIFEEIEHYNSLGSVVYDKKTKVMYWMSLAPHTSGRLTVLVNPDGTPRIWEE